MNKKIFFLLRTLLYSFFLIIIFKTILELATSFQYKFELPLPLVVLHCMPPLISYITAPLWINVLFFINILFIILEPLYIKKFNFKLSIILGVIHIFLNSLILIYLLLNFNLIEIDRNIFLPVLEIYYYKLTFFLFITYFIILIYNIYSKLKFIRKNVTF